MFAPIPKTGYHPLVATKPSNRFPNHGVIKIPAFIIAMAISLPVDS